MKKYKRTKKGRLHIVQPKKERSKKLWVIIVVVVMAMSIIGFMTFDFEDEEKYNDFTLIPAEGGWKVKIEKNYINFFIHPAEAESIAMSNETRKVFDKLKESAMFYFTMDPEDQEKEILGYIEYDLMNAFSKKEVLVAYAFTKENEFEKPVIDCEDATETVPVIKFQSDKSFNVTSDNNCIIIKATGKDFVRVRDFMLYKLYKVIN